MRKVTFGGANSLDNYIARADHSVDWLVWIDEVAAVTAELWKTVDAVMTGRKTYEAAVQNGLTAYPGVKNYVCSRTMADDPGRRVSRCYEWAPGKCALRRGWPPPHGGLLRTQLTSGKLVKIKLVIVKHQRIRRPFTSRNPCAQVVVRISSSERRSMCEVYVR